MKKLKLIVLLSSISICGMAQTFFLKAGISYSRIATSDLSYQNHLGLEEIKGRIGFTAGLGFNIPLNEHFSIQPELSFIEKGTIESSSGKGSDYDDTGLISFEYSRNIKINYLELPVLFRYSFGDKTKFFLNAGPSMAIGLGGTSTFVDIAKYDNGTPEGYTSGYVRHGKVMFKGEPWQVTDNDERLASVLDWGLQLGGGVLIKRIMIDVRYTHGFTNLYAPEPPFSNNTKNRNLQMTLGVPFQLGRK